MKKVVLMMLSVCMVCIVFAGCNNWEKDFTITKLDRDFSEQVERAVPRPDGKNHLLEEYTIKNNTNRTMSNVKIVFEFTEGITEHNIYEHKLSNSLGPNQEETISFAYYDIMNDKDTLITKFFIKKVNYKKQ